MNKKLLLPIIFILCILFSENNLHSQSVLNGGFENWSHISIELPDVSPPTSVFDNSNYRLIYSTVNRLNMTKITNGAGYAMRLETISYASGNNPDTSVGFGIWGGSPHGGSPLIFPGGFPFTDKNVNGLTVDLRYNINVASPGVVSIQFKKNGIPIDGGNAPLNEPGTYSFPVFGNQASFTTMSFSFPPLSIVPDTCVIAFVSNNPSGTAYPGNYMEVDNVVLTGTTQTVPGGDLDTWFMEPLIESLNDWNFDGDENSSIIYRTTDKNSGNYAVQLNTYDRGGGNFEPQKAQLGRTIYGTTSNTYIPGTAITRRPLSLAFYYKYSTPGIDSGFAYVRLTKWNGTSRIVVGKGVTYLLPSGSYAYNSAMIDYQTVDIPDSAFIMFTSSINYPGVAGSLLKVDDVKFYYCDETIDAGIDQSVCSGSPDVTLAGSVIESTSQLWSAGGIFNPDNTTLNAIYTPSAIEIAAGTATLTLSAMKADCPTVTDQMVITISVCTGIKSAFMKEFNIYPSPASNTLNIEAIGVMEIKDITMLNALQQKVDVKILEINGGGAKLDLTMLDPGIYFIRISNGTAISVQKIAVE